MGKPRVAFFDFAGCEGDQLTVINLEEQLLDVLKHVEVVSFREAMKEHSDNYDIAFVEGSCTRRADEERLKKIRASAKIVVAIGACATIGGINALAGKPVETPGLRNLNQGRISGCPFNPGTWGSTYK